MADAPKIFPLGDGAVTIDFGNEISVELNNRAVALASHFERRPFPGFVEAVPAYASVAIFYDLKEVRRSFPKFETAFSALKNLIDDAVDADVMTGREQSRTIDIPTDFGGDASLDLAQIAEHSGLTGEEVISIFTAQTYRVYMLGFLPGFSYMGEVDERIAIPRKSSPRLRVPKGSVGIAGRQTGIYPLESPGGWQILGRTDLEMFTPDAETPCRLRPGDLVRFVRST